MGFSAIFAAFCLSILCSSLSSAYDVTYDDRAIKIDGQRKLLISGSIHYPRSTPGMWPSLIRKSKEGGLNTIETYVFWNAHEPQPRQYDFAENLDLVRFIKTIRDEGLYAILRIGPYVCAEWDYGGFPIWLHSLPGIKMRTNNDVFKNEMQIFTTYIVDMMKREGLFASQGGPILLAQIENEYGNVQWAYGDDGKKYLDWCAKMADNLKIGIPWVMCQQDDAPSPMLSACNGYYCDQWSPKNSSIPKIWTENWSGWFMDWGNRVPRRTAEDLAFAVARFFQLGGAVQNYYMYHGGTNFGKSAGGPYITTSYDYDAPLDEYGNTRQPKWGHLKNLHLTLMSMEEALVYGERTSVDYQNNTYVTIFAHQGKRSCFFSNTDEKNDRTLTFEGSNYFIPAWSVSILPDCYTEVYNTAKVNAQTSIMEKRPNEADDFQEPYALTWQWKSEKIPHINADGILDRSFSFVSNVLMDQKRASNGSSDYLWLLTNYEHNTSDPQWGNDKDIILHVHTDGHVVHAFVNGKYYGSQWAENGHYEFIFEKRIQLKPGNNSITLASVTVGLPNYGENYDTVRVGIHGPVKLIARSKTGEPDVKDISSSRWVYKTGLIGEDQGLNQVQPRHISQWETSKLPNNRPFVWYKTSFKGPMGSDPVVVDLLGLGKGVAWINGRSIGRYWPKYLASEQGCDVICDYRAAYKPEKCNTGCGKPSQRFYHVPRDWLKADDNQLVLFEELGGNPYPVNFQTVTVGKVCANAYEGHTLELACHAGSKFSNIKFASFGLPEGDCGHFNVGTCHSEKTLSVVQKACLGKERCVLHVTEDSFGPLRCRADTYRLAVEAVC
ncbi:beta-galactosidase 15 [Manihot esculenta]|uniref:Beta-galactosidase n=1 Tax=Manihot esculenta TaxID=3983 RepID=A0A2C9VEG8_MANES|nr:beta-galactosidase 15 [Manihot esculenta]OAY42814.1 hypothetical protein MANES_08G017800v8 [Manihot esculenta]